jgi:GDP-L-fucose synthase
MVVGRTSGELDLRDAREVEDFFARERPDVVILAAARVGGIAANAAFPIDYMSDNLRIELNVMDSARAHGIDRLVFIGSAAAYPRTAVSPIAEDQLLTGPPERAHAGYALAKLCGVQYVENMRAEGAMWTTLMPTNIYGPNDNFHPEWSHVVPALLRKLHLARLCGDTTAAIWGTGEARREFLYVDDLASACLLAAMDPPPQAFLNVGSGSEVTIRELAKAIAEVVDFRGELGFDPSHPDGVERRSLDSSALRTLSWEPTVDLHTGLSRTYAWMLDHWENLRD